MSNRPRISLKDLVVENNARLTRTTGKVGRLTQEQLNQKRLDFINFRQTARTTRDDVDEQVKLRKQFNTQFGSGFPIASAWFSNSITKPRSYDQIMNTRETPIHAWVLEEMVGGTLRDDARFEGYKFNNPPIDDGRYRIEVTYFDDDDNLQTRTIQVTFPKFNKYADVLAFFKEDANADLYWALKAGSDSALAAESIRIFPILKWTAGKKPQLNKLLEGPTHCFFSPIIRYYDKIIKSGVGRGNKPLAESTIKNYQTRIRKCNDYMEEFKDGISKEEIDGVSKSLKCKVIIKDVHDNVIFTNTKNEKGSAENEFKFIYSDVNHLSAESCDTIIAFIEQIKDRGYYDPEVDVVRTISKTSKYLSDKEKVVVPRDVLKSIEKFLIHNKIYFKFYTNRQKGTYKIQTNGLTIIADKLESDELYEDFMQSIDQYSIQYTDDNPYYHLVQNSYVQKVQFAYKSMPETNYDLVDFDMTKAYCQSKNCPHYMQFPGYISHMADLQHIEEEKTLEFVKSHIGFYNCTITDCPYKPNEVKAKDVEEKEVKEFEHYDKITEYLDIKDQLKEAYSRLARKMILNWNTTFDDFVKLIPDINFKKEEVEAILFILGENQLVLQKNQINYTDLELRIKEITKSKTKNISNCLDNRLKKLYLRSVQLGAIEKSEIVTVLEQRESELYTYKKQLDEYKKQTKTQIKKIDRSFSKQLKEYKEKETNLDKRWKDVQFQIRFCKDDEKIKELEKELGLISSETKILKDQYPVKTKQCEEKKELTPLEKHLRAWNIKQGGVYYFTSPMISFLSELGLKIQLNYGCWTAKPIDIEFSKEMRETKTPDLIPLYSYTIGTMAMESQTKRVNFFASEDFNQELSAYNGDQLIYVAIDSEEKPKKNKQFAGVLSKEEYIKKMTKRYGINNLSFYDKYVTHDEEIEEEDQTEEIEEEDQTKEIETGIYTFNIPKKDYEKRNHKHIAAYILSYTFINVMKEAMKYDTNHLYAVKVDSLLLHKDANPQDNELFRIKNNARGPALLNSPIYKYFKNHKCIEIPEGLKKNDMPIDEEFIIGQGGSGKSYHFCEDFEKINYKYMNILYVCPTNKLKQYKITQMENKFGKKFYACTVAKLLGGSNFRSFSEECHEKFGVIFIDEATMISEETMLRIKQKYPDCKIYFAGDFSKVKRNVAYQAILDTPGVIPLSLYDKDLKIRPSYEFQQDRRSKQGDPIIQLKVDLRKCMDESNIIRAKEIIFQAIPKNRVKFDELAKFYNDGDICISYKRELINEEVNKILKDKAPLYRVKNSNHRLGIYRGDILTSDKDEDGNQIKQSYIELRRCFTAHSIQGETIEEPRKVFIMLDDLLKEPYFKMRLLYTAVSRVRSINQLVIVTHIPGEVIENKEENENINENDE